jgi:ornithine carbamoyltransferase
MVSLLTIDDLSPADIEHIFELADGPFLDRTRQGSPFTAAYSFEGNSIRTRTTFLKALNSLGIQAIEAPNFLKTGEPVEHLAGYMDNWVDLYIIRERDHGRLHSFIETSRRPVINALTRQAHPCEVLADAYSIRASKGPLADLTYCIVGPPTNVLNSWHTLADVLGLRLKHVMPKEFLAEVPLWRQSRIVTDKSAGLSGADVVLTDAWPTGFNDRRFRLTLDDLAVVNEGTWVIPCPPFNTANEISDDVIASEFFAGYAQKTALYPVQRAIIQFLIDQS